MVADSRAMKGLCCWVHDGFGAVYRREGEALDSVGVAWRDAQWCEVQLA